MPVATRATETGGSTMFRSILRPLAATALAAALVLAVVPAASAAPGDGGPAVTSPLAAWQWLHGWLDRLFAASEAGPGMDPNGSDAQAGPHMDPNGVEAELDPDGTQSDAGPHMDPDG
jgi:hypothetical protein